MPDPAISPEQVRKVAKLARLSLTDEQVERFRGELSAVLAYVERLRELELDGVEPLANPCEEPNRLRGDDAAAAMAREVFLRNAPVSEGPFVVVPKVLGDSGES